MSFPDLRTCPPTAPAIAMPVDRRAAHRIELALPRRPRILLAERHAVPLVYFSWVAPAGVRHEPEGQEGIATLSAHLQGQSRAGLVAGADRDCGGVGLGGWVGWVWWRLVVVSLVAGLERGCCSLGAGVCEGCL